MRLALIAFAACLALTGCGDESGDAESTSACEKAPPRVVKPLEASLTVPGGGRLENAQIVEVDDPPSPTLAGFNEGVWVVSGRMTGSGEAGVASFAASRAAVETGNGLAFPIDVVTQQFSSLSGATVPGADAYLLELEANDAFKQSRECALDG